MSKMNQRNDGAEPVISTFLHSRARAMGMPASGTFELTSRCNFNCKMCYVHDSHCTAEGELSTARWLDIAKQSCDMGMLFLLLTGGEPLLREDFEELYCKMKEMGLVVSINTNASLLSGKTLELFKKNPPSRLNVSLYGASEETYKNLTGGKHFERVLSNLKAAKEAEIPFKINLSLTPYNVHDMEKIHKIADELDVHIKGTTYMFPPLRRGEDFSGLNPGRFTAEESAFYRTKYSVLHNGKERFVEKAKLYKENFCKSENECAEQSFDDEINGVRCRAGSSSFWINYKGEMTACGMFSTKSYNVPELGVAKAWESVVRDTKEIRLPKECLTCKYKGICNVCAAVCLCESGDFSKKPEYVCEFSRLASKFTIEEYERLNEI